MSKVLDSNTCCLDGIYLIEASAGTGKTYNIQNLAVRLILEEGLTIDQILIVTFTRAATAELSDRIRKILQSSLEFLSQIRYEEGAPVFPEGFGREKALLSLATKGFQPDRNETCRKKLQEALLDFDNNAISTIDGFCQRMLSRNAFESGILFETRLMEQENSTDMIVHLIRNQWRRICYDPENRFSGFYRGVIDLDHYFEDQSNAEGHEFLLHTSKEFSKRPANQIRLDKLIEYPDVDFDSGVISEPQEVIAEQTAEILKKLSGDLNKIKGDLKLPKDFQAPPGFDDVPGKKTIMSWEDFAEQQAEQEAACSCPDADLRKRFFSGLRNLRGNLQKLRVSLLREIRQNAVNEFLQLKEQENFQTFRDLQRRMIEALSRVTVPGQPSDLYLALRKQFKAAIIDEFQDTDQTQYQIFMDVFSPAPAKLFLVGDPKQAIYAFRGGDIFTYKQAASEIRGYGEDHIQSLNTNFRSADQLVQSVNRIFSSHSLPFADPEILFSPSGSCGKSPMKINGEIDPEPLHCLELEPKTELCYRKSADEILSLLNGDVQIPASDDESEWRKLQPSDIAILFRSKLGMETMTEELRKRGIPFVVLDDVSLYDSQEAKDMLFLLKAMMHPADLQTIQLFMQTNFSGRTSCRELLAADQKSIKDLISETQQKLFLAGKIFQEKGFLRAFTCFADTFNIHQSLLTLPDGAQRYSNLLQLRDILLQEEKNGRRTPDSMTAWLKQQIYPQTRTDFSETIALASDSPAVRIMTIHKSKGLQFPVVFLPDLSSHALKEKYNDNYHDPNAGNRIVKCTPRADQKPPYPDLEALQEEIRITYVALTRAARACYLCIEQKPEIISAVNWLFLGKKIAENGPIEPENLISAFKKSQEENPKEELPDSTEPPEEKIPDGAVYQTPEPGETFQLRWTAQVPQPPAKLSYTEIHRYYRTKHDLNSREEEEIPAELQTEIPLISRKAEKDQLPEIFTLPKGDLFGNACHDILERLDFQHPEQLEHLIPKHLSAVNIGEKKEIAERMFRNVISAPIPCDGGGTFTLQDVALPDRCSEIEFDFQDPSGFRPAQLAKKINDFFREELEKFSLNPLETVIPIPHDLALYTGKTDLICAAQGKYYIIDWKTDILDNDFSNFQAEKLFVPMWEKFYLYQSLLYSSAFLRYLSFRTGKSPETVWKELFGGVRYLFLRGMDPAHPGRGVFSSKPAFHVIQEIAGGLS